MLLIRSSNFSAGSMRWLSGLRRPRRRSRLTRLSWASSSAVSRCCCLLVAALPEMAYQAPTGGRHDPGDR